MKLHSLQKPKNKAFLIVLETSRDPSRPYLLEENYRELKELTESALIYVTGGLTAKVYHPSPSHFVREGKLQEIILEAKKAGANVLIFNVDLTPVQARNIEKACKIPIIDRTGLILDIFGRRAKSREGQLQVELARLNYVLPRLGGLGGVMSRLGGGVGTRGPGEQELEHDRRKIRGRIERVKEELKKVRKHRDLLRSGRKRKQFLTAAIVGYTNAGKSTLMNALTGAGVYVENKMFATLDPKIRTQNLNGRRDILFVDTVGFLKELPHTLIESFHATLEEVTQADVLIHVLDVSHPRARDLYRSVMLVLDEIGAADKPMVLALNKTDLLNEASHKAVLAEWPGGILISAQQGLGVHGLLEKVNSLVPPLRSNTPWDPPEKPFDSHLPSDELPAQDSDGA